jgi:hypothetical protein
MDKGVQQLAACCLPSKLPALAHLGVPVCLTEDGNRGDAQALGCRRGAGREAGAPPAQACLC